MSADSAVEALNAAGLLALRGWLGTVGKCVTRVPPPPGLRARWRSVPYFVDLSLPEGVRLPGSDAFEVGVSARISFYCSRSRAFFGATVSTPVVLPDCVATRAHTQRSNNAAVTASKRGPTSHTCRASALADCYWFHAATDANSVWLVVELVANAVAGPAVAEAVLADGPRSSLRLDAPGCSVVDGVSIGWTVYEFRGGLLSSLYGTAKAAETNVPWARYQLFAGTPAVLPFLDAPFTDDLSPLAGATVHLRVGTAKAFDAAANSGLIPPFTLAALRPLAPLIESAARDGRLLHTTAPTEVGGLALAATAAAAGRTDGLLTSPPLLPARYACVFSRVVVRLPPGIEGDIVDVATGGLERLYGEAGAKAAMRVAEVRLRLTPFGTHGALGGSVVVPLRRSRTHVGAGSVFGAAGSVVVRGLVATVGGTRGLDVPHDDAEAFVAWAAREPYVDVDAATTDGEAAIGGGHQQGGRECCIVAETIAVLESSAGRASRMFVTMGIGIVLPVDLAASTALRDAARRNNAHGTMGDYVGVPGLIMPAQGRSVGVVLVSGPIRGTDGKSVLSYRDADAAPLEPAVPVPPLLNGVGSPPTMVLRRAPVSLTVDWVSLVPGAKALEEEVGLLPTRARLIDPADDDALTNDLPARAQITALSDSAAADAAAEAARAAAAAAEAARLAELAAELEAKKAMLAVAAMDADEASHRRTPQCSKCCRRHHGSDSDSCSSSSSSDGGHRRTRLGDIDAAELLGALRGLAASAAHCHADDGALIPHSRAHRTDLTPANVVEMTLLARGVAGLSAPAGVVPMTSGEECVFGAVGDASPWPRLRLASGVSVLSTRGVAVVKMAAAVTAAISAAASGGGGAGAAGGDAQALGPAASSALVATSNAGRVAHLHSPPRIPHGLMGSLPYVTATPTSAVGTHLRTKIVLQFLGVSWRQGSRFTTNAVAASATDAPSFHFTGHMLSRPFTTASAPVRLGDMAAVPWPQHHTSTTAGGSGTSSFAAMAAKRGEARRVATHTSTRTVGRERNPDLAFLQTGRTFAMGDVDGAAPSPLLDPPMAFLPTLSGTVPPGASGAHEGREYPDVLWSGGPGCGVRVGQAGVSVEMYLDPPAALSSVSGGGGEGGGVTNANVSGNASGATGGGGSGGSGGSGSAAGYAATPIATAAEWTAWHGAIDEYLATQRMFIEIHDTTSHTTLGEVALSLSLLRRAARETHVADTVALPILWTAYPHCELAPPSADGAAAVAAAALTGCYAPSGAGVRPLVGTWAAPTPGDVIFNNADGIRAAQGSFTSPPPSPVPSVVGVLMVRVANVGTPIPPRPVGTKGDRAVTLGAAAAAAASGGGDGAGGGDVAVASAGQLGLQAVAASQAIRCGTGAGGFGSVVIAPKLPAAATEVQAAAADAVASSMRRLAPHQMAAAAAGDALQRRKHAAAAAVRRIAIGGLVVPHDAPSSAAHALMLPAYARASTPPPVAPGGVLVLRDMNGAHNVTLTPLPAGDVSSFTLDQIGASAGKPLGPSVSKAVAAVNAQKAASRTAAIAAAAKQSFVSEIAIVTVAGDTTGVPLVIRNTNDFAECMSISVTVRYHRRGDESASGKQQRGVSKHTAHASDLVTIVRDADRAHALLGASVSSAPSAYAHAAAAAVGDGAARQADSIYPQSVNGVASATATIDDPQWSQRQAGDMTAVWACSRRHAHGQSQPSWPPQPAFAPDGTAVLPARASATIVAAIRAWPSETTTADDALVDIEFRYPSGWLARRYILSVTILPPIISRAVSLIVPAVATPAIRGIPLLLPSPSMASPLSIARLTAPTVAVSDPSVQAAIVATPPPPLTAVDAYNTCDLHNTSIAGPMVVLVVPPIGRAGAWESCAPAADAASASAAAPSVGGCVVGFHVENLRAERDAAVSGALVRDARGCVRRRRIFVSVYDGAAQTRAVETIAVDVMPVDTTIITDAAVGTSVRGAVQVRPLAHAPLPSHIGISVGSSDASVATALPQTASSDLKVEAMSDGAIILKGLPPLLIRAPIPIPGCVRVLLKVFAVGPPKPAVEDVFGGPLSFAVDASAAAAQLAAELASSVEEPSADGDGAAATAAVAVAGRGAADDDLREATEGAPSTSLASPPGGSLPRSQSPAESAVGASGAAVGAVDAVDAAAGALVAVDTAPQTHIHRRLLNSTARTDVGAVLGVHAVDIYSRFPAPAVEYHTELSAANAGRPVVKKVAFSNAFHTARVFSVHAIHAFCPNPSAQPPHLWASGPAVSAAPVSMGGGGVGWVPSCVPGSPQGPPVCHVEPSEFTLAAGANTALVLTFGGLTRVGRSDLECLQMFWCGCY